MDNEFAIGRITNTIFLFALRDGASEVRLHAGILGVQVLCLMKGEWSEETPLPLPLWDDLKARIALMSENWDTAIQLAMRAKSFRCAARLEREFPHETVVLAFEEEAGALARASGRPV